MERRLAACRAGDRDMATRGSGEANHPFRRLFTTTFFSFLAQAANCCLSPVYGMLVLGGITESLPMTWKLKIVTD